MKVAIDSSKCQGHGRCLMYDTDVFVCDELGYASVRGDGSVPEPDRESVWLASLNCPEHAITVQDS